MVKIVATCEHATNKIPDEYQHLFMKYGDVLESHKGYDIGAAKLFTIISSTIADYHLSAEVSRLLVDVNRSLGHGELFSFITKSLSDTAKEKIIKRYYLPYRNKIEDKIQEYVIMDAVVIHLSIHTFTPVLNNKVRKADIGLLYDPRRKGEKLLCTQMKHRLSDPHIKVHLNYPYRGTSDGLTSYFRKKFDEEHYVGIEIEINQKFCWDKEKWGQLQYHILQGLRSCVTKSLIQN
ncbi:MAG: N-formylglutamate amidohydrolase [bacterium]